MRTAGETGGQMVDRHDEAPSRFSQFFFERAKKQAYKDTIVSFADIQCERRTGLRANLPALVTSLRCFSVNTPRN